MASVGTLEEEARKRKERLRNLARKQKEDETAEENNEESTDKQEKLPRPVFRSYRPQAEELQDSVLPRIKPGDVTMEVQTQLQSGKSEHVVSEVDLTNLAPRKPDWDLKRDCAKKLEKLEKRTQRAIAELIRERLKASQNDLVTVVSASEAVARADDDDD
ncbi:coiled-coil domain-containing protein 12-like [Babylonia areolata]|uniref:coiled-coil domain-containing protein 12-like n=1 Tax=Babylonia areolata TaxID=304850 RepID=UPI003FD09DED